MSTPLTESTFTLSGITARNAGTHRWLREPLLHFFLLGAVLFAADHFIASRADDPYRIVVGPEVDSEAIETFRASRNREPNASELEALHRIWLDNEVLYREGLALQVDKGDSAIRERVIFKALSVIDANVKLPVLDDPQLKAWFESHRTRYDVPERYDFQEAALSGAADEPAVRAFVAKLNAGTPGDAKAGLRVFDGRPRLSLDESYGIPFASALAAATPGQWTALQTRDGWHAMRLVAIRPAEPANFDALRGVVLQDWKDAVASEQRTAAVRALAKKYRIEFVTATHRDVE